MADKNRKRDPMPPPDATPEEIGEFWDTHSLADYWDETHEVEFQVNLKSRESLSPDEADGVEQGWQKLKELIQSMGRDGHDFEKLVAALLTSFLKVDFVVAGAGAQPSGDARSLTGEVSIQAKNYSDKTSLDATGIEVDIRRVNRTLQYLEVYILAVSRKTTAQLRDTLDAVEAETGLDIVVLELTDDLSDLGALCVTFWEDIHEFFDSSDICQDQNFLAWVEERKDDSETKEKIKDLRLKLEDGIQTQKLVQKDIEKYLLKRFSRGEGFNPINLSQAIDREIESQISDWWKTEGAPICCLEGKEGHGKSWLAAKWINSIREKENIVTFWLDSRYWSGAKSISDLLRSCFSLLPYEERKIAKLQNKPAKIWRKTLIILDGVNECAIEAAQQILDEYFRNNESEWRDRIRFLLTTRPLDDYPKFERYLWSECHKIPVDPFNDSELQEALNRQDLQPDDLPDSLKEEVARIPRYFQRCIELRDEFGSLDVVTKAMVLWADLLDKIERTDPQIKQKFGWHRAKDAQGILAYLAKQAKWTNVGPQASVKLLEKCFGDYREVLHDLKELNIAIEAELPHAKLSKDHVKLGWALYLANLFDCTKFTDIKDFAEGFQNALQPIPPEDLRTEALFVALQITERSPDPEISQDQLSQKRAALMIAWFHSHNAQITDERISFWVQTDTDAYAQFAKVQLETHNQSSYEEALIEPLAKAWLHETGQIDQLRLRLTKWFLTPLTDDGSEDIVYVGHKGNQFPREKGDIQAQLSRAAISILSQRPERQFLNTLASCYAGLQNQKKSDKNPHRLFYFSEHLGRLMRWGYTEAVLEDLRLLAEQAQVDEFLLNGIYELASHLQVADLPSRLQRPLSEEDIERRNFIEQWNRGFKSYINRIRDQERLLKGESPAANVEGNYHGLGYLAVRTDLPNLCHEDLVEIKKVLRHISVNTKLAQGLSASLEGFCIENLIPWVAKYSPENYAELACNLKLNALNQKWAHIVFLSIQGLIFKLENRIKITEAILEMKQRLVQDVQVDSSSSDTIYLTSVLTETLLFCAPEEKLTDWFNLLASHEPLRISICYDTLPYLLEKLLPESIVELAQQKLETLWSSSSDNQTGDNGESKEFSEEKFWCTLYAYGVPVDENTVNYALEALKIREPDSTGAFPLLRLALSCPNQFLAEALTDEKIRRHLFSRHGKWFIIPIYDGEDVPSYNTLMSLLPPRIIGSFLCSPDRCSDLSQWGKDIIEWIFSNLQSIKVDFDYNSEMGFSVNPKILQTWAEQNTTGFSQLADQYLTELSKFPQYSQALSGFTDAILCLLLRFEPTVAMRHYRQSKAKGFRIVCSTSYGVETSLAQLWQVEECKLSEHRDLRRKLLEECLNDEDIMFMTLAALAGGGEEELWNLVTQEYLASPYAKERNLGVSILPWFGDDKAIEKLEELKSDDPID